MIKRKVIALPVGNTNKMFDIEEEFVEDSFWIFEVAQDGSTKFHTVAQTMGTFIVLQNVPVGDSKLYIMYEVNTITGQQGLLAYDYERIERISVVLLKHSEQIAELLKGLELRITKKEMLRWQEAMKTELMKLNTNVNLLKE